jgi:formate/nitrite transporter
MMTAEIRIDALLPIEMARQAEKIGVRKAEGDTFATFALAVLAGAFISLGAVFATTVATGNQVGFGEGRLMTGFVFCLGLVLVIIGGAELFTGNNLIIMAWASRRVTTRSLLRNWTIVYIGNIVGSIGTVVIMFFSQQYSFADGAIGETVLTIAVAKVNLDFFQAIVLGILGNMLVCLAVWLSFSARSTFGKIMAIIFPITAFVAAGFEHSVANMYFLPIGLAIKTFDSTFAASTGLDLAALTPGSAIAANLLPVTIGNIIGGSIFVAGIYWLIYLRPRD